MADDLRDRLVRVIAQWQLDMHVAVLGIDKRCRDALADRLAGAVRETTAAQDMALTKAQRERDKARAELAALRAEVRKALYRTSPGEVMGRGILASEVPAIACALGETKDGRDI